MDANKFAASRAAMILDLDFVLFFVRARWWWSAAGVGRLWEV